MQRHKTEHSCAHARGLLGHGDTEQLKAFQKKLKPQLI
ncbi:hypothetical protein PAMC26577_14325 [Caballeronia sordidicola]|uniref:Uncharacterized protein n=1 Tax=Caballeronia sordidicola TaxID=196367 RepID=A0A242MUA0_CABSO|nr:hypothetical protein PAMC26577_14325 [Caballeronia sordidicola]